jgi:hypothetical protein
VRGETIVTCVICVMEIVIMSSYTGWFRPSRRDRWRFVVDGPTYAEATRRLADATDQLQGGEVTVTESIDPNTGHPIAPTLFDAAVQEA